MKRTLYNLKNIRYRLFHGEKILKRIRGIPEYFLQKHYLHKHGYDIAARWDTDLWFISTIRDVLTEYLNHHTGCPCLDETIPTDKWHEEWEKVIERMIELLDMMDSYNPIYEIDYTNETTEATWRKEKEDYEKMNSAKDEFFQLFSKWFYYLWD